LIKPIAFALTVLLFSQAGVADDAACKVPLDAVTNVLATPNHQYMTRIDAAGAKRQSEIINTGIAMYVEVGGKWRTSSMSSKGMQALMIESQKRATATSCKLLRAESVDGASAAVYSIHDETEAGVSDTTLWVSKSDGLPLRQEIDLKAGDAAGKSHSEVRFVYKDVKAPPGVD